VSWFRVDDGFHSHPKVLAAGNAAVGLFIRCGSYCAQHLTDGFVADAVAGMYGSRAEIARVTAAGLWARCEGGFSIPDYLAFNPSREQVMAERARNAERQARHRERNGGRNGVTPTVSNDAPTRPDPGEVPNSTTDDDRDRRDGSSSMFDHTVQVLAEAAWLLQRGSVRGKKQAWLTARARNIALELRDRIVSDLAAGQSPSEIAAAIIGDQTTVAVAVRNVLGGVA